MTCGGKTFPASSGARFSRSPAATSANMRGTAIACAAAVPTAVFSSSASMSVNVRPASMACAMPASSRCGCAEPSGSRNSTVSGLTERPSASAATIGSRTSALRL